LSPDGKWAVSVFTGNPQHISLFPIGAGQSQQISVPALEHLENGSAHFLPDGKRVVVNGNVAGHPSRTFLVDFVGGSPEPVTPEGVHGTLVSPDGKYVVARNQDHSFSLFPIAGGQPVPIPIPAADEAAQW